MPNPIIGMQSQADVNNLLNQMDTSTFIKYIRDIIEGTPQTNLQSLKAETVQATSQLIFSDKITQPTKFAKIHYIGATGESAFTNSWVNFSSTQTAAYILDPWGYVHFMGGIKSGTLGSAAFTLPPGVRPSQNREFAVVSNAAFGYVTVGSDGTVTPKTPSSNTSVFLDNIVYKIA